MIRLLLCVIFIPFFTAITARSYYLSEKGDNKQSGNSPRTAWLTLDRLQNIMPRLQPGDSVLFERGSVFYGSLNITAYGTPQHLIYFGAYGKGSKPVIDGAVPLKDWILFKKNIWVITCATCIAMPGDLFIDGRLQMLGRYPNNGYLTCTAANKNAAVTDATSGVPNGYWDGAELVVKSKRWVLDKTVVQSHNNKTLTFRTPVSYNLEDHTAYFMQNHLATLDKPGEWYFDAENKNLFLWLGDNVQPNKYNIMVSMEETGLSVKSSHNLIIENIAFMHQKRTSVTLENSSYVQFINNDIAFCSGNGLDTRLCEHITVKNNTITDINNNGVMWTNNDDGQFINNSIRRTGIRPGRGASGDGAYIALHITGGTKDKQNLFQHNIIDSTGYSAIDFRNGATHISDNTISNFCLLKDDGAAIYTWKNTYGNNVIEKNTVTGRSSKNTLPEKEAYLHGIYIDDLSQNLVLRENTISSCAASGIYIHNSGNITIVGNKLSGNGENLAGKDKGQLLLRRDKIAPGADGDIKGLDVSNNKMICTREDQYCIYLSFQDAAQVLKAGTFKNNQYTAPAHGVIASEQPHQEPCDAPDEWNLASWQQFSGQDQQSTVTAARYSMFEPAGNNLVSNGNMSRSKEGWITWPEGTTSQIERQGNDVSLKVTLTGDQVMLYHAGFSLKKGKVYRLSFTAKGSEKSTIQFVPLMATAPWKALGDYTCFTLDTTEKTFTCYFVAEQSFANARVNFKGTSAFWIGDVMLQEVTMSNAPAVRDSSF